MSAVEHFNPARANEPTMTLGQLCQRLRPLYITEAGLSSIGFDPVARHQAARLYYVADFPLICAGILQLVLRVQFGDSRWVAL